MLFSSLSCGITAIAAQVTVNATSVSLYVLDHDYAKKISIPTSYKKSFQLKVQGATGASYAVTAGDSVTVSASGLVRPATQTWYWLNGFGSTWSTGNPNEVVEVRYKTGVSTITVKAGGQSFQVKVTVHDYAPIYVDGVLDAFVKKSLTDGMTQQAKFTAITKYVAQNYSYDYQYSSAIGLVIFGGGDCWANSDAMLRLCKKVGIPAHLRYAANDPGAGSGHRNVVALCDGVLYEGEAGYTGSAPRSYYVSKLPSEFTFYSNTVTQYDGFKNNIVVPASINGEPVTAIGEVDGNVFRYGELYSDVKVYSVSIPASVRYISPFAFGGCENIKSITVAAANPAYSSADGVLYNKDKKELLYYPIQKSTAPVIPEGVETLTNAFYYNSRITAVTLPSTLKKIGIGSFYNCYNLKSVTIPSKVTGIGDYAFANCGGLQTLTVPKSVTSISDTAFSNTQWFTLRCYKGSYAHNYALKKGIKYDLLDKTSVSGLTAQLSAASYGYDGKAKTPAVTVKDGTKTLVKNTHYTVSYKNNINAGTASVVITGKGSDYTGTKTLTYKITPKSVSGLSAALSATSFAYNGSEKKPTVTLKNGSVSLTNNTHYTLSYQNNTNIGTASVSITGKGNYAGTLKKSFTIVPGKAAAKMSANTTNTLTLTWPSVAGAGGYQVYRYSAEKWVKVAETTAKSLQLKGLASGTSYSYRVRAYRVVGGKSYYGAFSSTVLAGTKPAQAKFSAVTSPSAGAVKSVWNKTSGASGYQLQLATNSAFSSGIKSYWLSGNSAVSKSVTGLAKGQSYYLRVRAYRTMNGVNYYGAWSAAKSVKCK